MEAAHIKCAISLMFSILLYGCQKADVEPTFIVASGNDRILQRSDSASVQFERESILFFDRENKKLYIIANGGYKINENIIKIDKIMSLRKNSDIIMEICAEYNKCALYNDKCEFKFISSAGPISLLSYIKSNGYPIEYIYHIKNNNEYIYTIKYFAECNKIAGDKNIFVNFNDHL